MTRKQRRLTMIASAGVVLAVAAGLVLFALRDQIVFFYSPTRARREGAAAGTRACGSAGSWRKARSCAATTAA